MEVLTHGLIRVHACGGRQRPAERLGFQHDRPGAWRPVRTGRRSDVESLRKTGATAMNPNRGRWTVALAAIVAVLLQAIPYGASAQQTTGVVRGRVVDESTQRPLASVQVLVVGTQRGTLTGTDGTYRIEGVPAGAHSVRAEYIGYGSHSEAVTVAAGAEVVADFALAQSVLDLEEIVVTGVAGQQVRAKLPFSVDRLTPQNMPVPASSATSMLTGKVAGLRTASSGGRPGETPSVMLRGPTSINASGRSQEPLYIVDGVILAGSVVDVDAMDIESIEVVKGAAAASLYGSRAANGVIQITTARGKNVANDQVTYSIRSEFGGSDLPGRFNLTQRHQFAMQNGLFVDQSGAPCEFVRCGSAPQLAGQMALAGEPNNEWNTIQQEAWPGATYDHVERFFRGGNYMTNAVSVAGRSGGTNYLVSYNRLDNEGIMPGHEGQLRHNFRVNLDQAVRTDITVSASAFYSRSRANSDDGAMFQLTRMPAGVDLLGPDPSDSSKIILKPDPFNDNVNPLVSMLEAGPNVQQRGRFLGSVTARWSPITWFNLDGNFSFDRSDIRNESFTPKDFRNLSNPNGTGGSLNHGNDRTEALNGSVTAQFIKRFGDLNTNTQLRYLVEQEDFTRTTANGSQFTADGVITFDNIPTANKSAGSMLQLERADGYFVITDLDYKDRYVVSALARNDGSSLFGPDERRHWYYRGSFAYRLSEEPWFNVPGFDELKLRYSYGTAGNRPSFAAQYETYSVSGGAITPLTLGNRNLKPEFVTEQEMGIDVLFLSRFSLDLTYAHADAKEQILNVPLLAHSGFSNQWRNAGRLKSNTIEASLNAQIIRTPDFTWNARVLFDRTLQEITELEVPAYQTGVTGQGLGNVFYVRPGEALGTFYGFQFAENCGHLPTGVDCSEFQVNDDGYLVWVGAAGSTENGWESYTDADGNQQHWWGTAAPFTVRGGTIRWGTPFQAEGNDPVTGERTTFLPLGRAMPDYSLSLSNTFQYKGITLYGLLQSVQGYHVYNQPLQWAVFQSYAGIMDQSNVAERARKPLGYYSTLYGASGLQPSSAFVDDASFVKLQEVALRYQIPTSLLERVPVARGFRGIGLSVVGRNLLTWTDYDGYDPDVGRTGGGTGSAVLARVDGFDYPNFRTFTFGLDINF
jgi:TonB-linked SusC/RagA family outer membrane protein